MFFSRKASRGFGLRAKYWIFQISDFKTQTFFVKAIIGIINLGGGGFHLHTADFMRWC